MDDLAPLLNDGSFLRHGVVGVARRDRAFVAAAYSVELAVTCDGADIDVVAGEVLGKTVVQVVEP